MKLKEVNQVLERRKEILSNLQSIEKLLQTDKQLAGEIIEKAGLTIPIDYMIAEVRSSYFSNEISRVQKALDEVEVSIPLNM